MLSRMSIFSLKNATICTHITHVVLADKNAAHPEFLNDHTEVGDIAKTKTVKLHAVFFGSVILLYFIFDLGLRQSVLLFF